MEKVILNIPHASTVVPEWAAGDICVSAAQLDRLVRYMTDKDVDKLWDFVPAQNKQVATVSRLVVDTERYRRDEDEPMFLKGMGLYYTHTPHGTQFRTRSEETYARCLGIYDAYHATLEEKVTRCLARHGSCVILDCHSFHDAMEYTEYDPASFPDVCIGVNGEVGAQAQWIVDTLRSAGYSVKVNEPFAGSLVPLKYWNDPRVRSVMIEFNRRIYDNSSFGRVRSLCEEIYAHLCKE